MLNPKPAWIYLSRYTGNTWQTMLILASHPRSGPQPFGCNIKNVVQNAHFPCMLYPFHPFDLIIQIILREKYKVQNFFINLLHSYAPSSLLGPKILLNALFCYQSVGYQTVNGTATLWNYITYNFKYENILRVNIDLLLTFKNKFCILLCHVVVIVFSV